MVASNKFLEYKNQQHACFSNAIFEKRMKIPLKLANDNFGSSKNLFNDQIILTP